MSGTSLDGIDAALVDLRPRGSGYEVSLVRSHTTVFTASFRARLLEALPPNEPSPRIVALLDAELGRALGQAAREIAGSSAPDYIASHGLTLYHDGFAGISSQIGDPFIIRECTGVTVIADFRRGDCAAGGQGAPLVPYVDVLLLADDHEQTIVLNIGGIANLTIVPARSSSEVVRAWDCGPGNMLIDALVRERTDGLEQQDHGGRYALAGKPNAQLLEAMASDPYFAQAPPKSTGRERFGAVFFAEHADAAARLSLEDACATFSALTVEIIARDIHHYAHERARVVVSGGGAHNCALLQGLRNRLPGHAVVRSEELGIHGDMKEATAFAILGYEALRGRPAGLPSVTGARCASVLGTIVPVNLAELLVKANACTA